METITIDTIENYNIDYSALPKLEIIHTRKLSRKPLEGNKPCIYAAAEEIYQDLQEGITSNVLTEGCTHVEELSGSNTKYGVKFFINKNTITFGVCRMYNQPTKSHEVMLLGEEHNSTIPIEEDKTIPSYSIMHIAAAVRHAYDLNHM